MYQIKKTTADVVAADTQASVSAIDYAVLTQARLTASIVEGAADAKLPIAASQRALQSMASGLNGLISGRGEIVAAIRQMNLVQMKSNLKTTSFGCPDIAGPETGADINSPTKSFADLIEG